MHFYHGPIVFALRIPRARPVERANRRSAPAGQPARNGRAAALEPLRVSRSGGSLRLRSQRRLRERVEHLDCGTGDAENLTTTTTQRNPGFESPDALRAQPIDQRLREIIWQCMRHAGQCSQSVSFAKQDLTLMPQELSIQRWISQNGGPHGRWRSRRRLSDSCAGRPAQGRDGVADRVDFLIRVVVVDRRPDQRRDLPVIHV
jgi:hypothetical protein